jgi:hypothetical protein
MKQQRIIKICATVTSRDVADTLLLACADLSDSLRWIFGGGKKRLLLTTLETA